MITIEELLDIARTSGNPNPSIFVYNAEGDNYRILTAYKDLEEDIIIEVEKIEHCYDFWDNCKK